MASSHPICQICSKRFQMFQADKQDLVNQNILILIPERFFLCHAHLWCQCMEFRMSTIMLLVKTILATFATWPCILFDKNIQWKWGFFCCNFCLFANLCHVLPVCSHLSLSRLHHACADINIRLLNKWSQGPAKWGYALYVSRSKVWKVGGVDTHFASSFSLEITLNIHSSE